VFADKLRSDQENLCPSRGRAYICGEETGLIGGYDVYAATGWPTVASGLGVTFSAVPDYCGPEQYQALLAAGRSGQSSTRFIHRLYVASTVI